MGATKLIDLVAVNFFDLIKGQKDGFVIQE